MLFGGLQWYGSFLSTVNAGPPGTIDSVDKYAWSENIGWLNFNPIGGDVAVTDTALTGDIWSENFGWINLNPTNGGVTNDARGNLGGFAWGEGIGYIGFSGVTIDGVTGEFEGYATNTIAGQISLNCSNTNSCGESDFKVRTNWRPDVVTPEQEISDDNNSSGGGQTRSVTRQIREAVYEQETLRPAAPEITLPGPEQGLVNSDSIADGMLREPRCERKTRPLFKDIGGHWAQEQIEILYSLCIIDGKTRIRFAPDEPISRQEMAKILLLTFSYSPNEAIRNPFSDVSDDSWARPYIATVANVGIFSGYTERRFLPRRNISRVESLKVFIDAAAFDPKTAPSLTLRDVTMGAWYEPFVFFGIEHNLIRHPARRILFAPHKKLTRAEASHMAVRMIEMLEEQYGEDSQ